MSKLLRQAQNAGRALELRMEEERGKYAVILAGMTVHHAQSCTNGTCEGNFRYTDNLSYRVIPSEDFDDAETAFESLKKQFLD